MLLCGAEESSSVTPVTPLDTPTHRLERLGTTLVENPEFQPNLTLILQLQLLQACGVSELETAVLRRRRRDHNG